LKRFIQHELESRLGRALIAGEIVDGARVTVDVEGGQLVVRPENQSDLLEERTETAA
jgi:ATP-dependent Clp protease ATP-binding subunit ClpB